MWWAFRNHLYPKLSCLPILCLPFATKQSKSIKNADLVGRIQYSSLT